MHRTRNIRWLLAFVWLTSSANAQQHDAFVHLDRQDGLIGESVLALEVDHLGFVWIGTTNGLSRHDCERIQNYHNIEGDSTSIPAARVDVIYEDSERRIWVGTQAGLAVYLPRENRFRHIDFGRPGAHVVHDIDELASGELLLSTWLHGMYLLNPDTEVVEHIVDGDGVLTENTTIRSVAVGPQESLWFSTYTDLWQLDLDSRTVSKPD